MGGGYDFEAMRRKMVDCQVRPADVTDLRVIDAMLAVPREMFLPDDQRALAYHDLDVPVRAGAGRRYVLKPATIARMLQAAGLAMSDRVLVVGCPTGYFPAVAARLAGSVTALECDPDLAARASSVLTMAGFGNVMVCTGNLSLGDPSLGPFDAILLAGATEIAPESLCRQLGPNGRLVGVFGDRPQRAMLVRHTHDGFGSRILFDVTAPILPGLARAPAFVF